ncbi:MAG: hypothetical protein HYY06_20085 [Deltaproteobacteria bacterium]|nr:hypothetical protein [Deltaproteobacteria bacterium]
MLIINLLVSAGAAFGMYGYAKRFNEKVLREEGEEVALVRSIDPTMVAIGTVILGIVAIPYTFYKTHGAIGILYGLAVCLGIGVCTVMTATALAWVAS